MSKTLAFPMQIDPRTGGWKVRKDKSSQLIDEVYQVACTAYNERMMLPDFGTGLWSRLFDVQGKNFGEEFAFEVSEACVTWLPGVSILTALVDFVDTAVLITLTVAYRDQEVKVRVPIKEGV